MTRRLILSIALGAAELAWDALRKVPGKVWAAAHAWLVVRAGERAKRVDPPGIHADDCALSPWAPCNCGASRPTGEMAVVLDPEEQAMVDGWEREPPVNAKGGDS